MSDITIKDVEALSVADLYAVYQRARKTYEAYVNGWVSAPSFDKCTLDIASTYYINALKDILQVRDGLQGQLFKEPY